MSWGFDPLECCTFMSDGMCLENNCVDSRPPGGQWMQLTGSWASRRHVDEVGVVADLGQLLDDQVEGALDILDDFLAREVGCLGLGGYLVEGVVAEGQAEDARHLMFSSHLGSLAAIRHKLDKPE